ncbi:mucin-7-like [Dermacentor silvarum]|uniref:mucin-7-like n=1 Tax=Dermacentor silvarum TaxID=543639 RepID=UPI0021006F83|nr:mucin-7-like [Dermacentor silvarum]
MAQTTSSSSPSAPGERYATARESCAAPTPQELLCGDNKTTAPPASRSFPDDEQPPTTLPEPSTTQLVSLLVLSNDHLASTPEHTKESACTPPPPELHDVPSPSRGDDSAASHALTVVETHISPPVTSEILRQHCGETGPPVITCTALPSYASVFPLEPLSPAPSRSTRSTPLRESEIPRGGVEESLLHY